MTPMSCSLCQSEVTCGCPRRMDMAPDGISVYLVVTWSLPDRPEHVLVSSSSAPYETSAAALAFISVSQFYLTCTVAVLPGYLNREVKPRPFIVEDGSRSLSLINFFSLFLGASSIHPEPSWYSIPYVQRNH